MVLGLALVAVNYNNICIYIYIYIYSADKQLIAINCIQNKSFIYIIHVCVLRIFIMFIYKHTHTVYIFKICTSMEHNFQEAMQ